MNLSKQQLRDRFNCHYREFVSLELPVDLSRTNFPVDFGELSVVGLLPAAPQDLDTDAMLNGAGHVTKLQGARSFRMIHLRNLSWLGLIPVTVSELKL